MRNKILVILLFCSTVGYTQQIEAGMINNFFTQGYFKRVVKVNEDIFALYKFKSGFKLGMNLHLEWSKYKGMYQFGVSRKTIWGLIAEKNLTLFDHFEFGNRIFFGTGNRNIYSNSYIDETYGFTLYTDKKEKKSSTPYIVAQYQPSIRYIISDKHELYFNFGRISFERKGEEKQFNTSNVFRTIDRDPINWNRDLEKETTMEYVADFSFNSWGIGYSYRFGVLKKE